MTTSSRVLLFVGILAVASSGAAQSGSSGNAAKPAFSLTISTEQDIAKAGSEIKVKIVLTNISDHEIPVYKDNSGKAELEGYVVELHDSDGKAARKRKNYRRLTGERAPEDGVEEWVTVTSGGIASLQPGKTSERATDVSKLYDLSQPGKYTIQVRRLDSESKTEVKSNTITVTVTQ